MLKLWRARRQMKRQIKLMEKRTQEFHAIADAVNRMTDVTKGVS